MVVEPRTPALGLQVRPRPFRPGLRPRVRERGDADEHTVQHGQGDARP
jgi:hypothetical protein